MAAISSGSVSSSNRSVYSDRVPLSYIISNLSLGAEKVFIVNYIFFSFWSNNASHI
jgi:hypothetical protein